MKARQEELVRRGGNYCQQGFSYCSDTNTEWLSVKEIQALVAQYCAEHGIE